MARPLGLLPLVSSENLAARLALRRITETRKKPTTSKGAELVSKMLSCNFYSLLCQLLPLRQTRVLWAGGRRDFCFFMCAAQSGQHTTTVTAASGSSCWFQTVVILHFQHEPHHTTSETPTTSPPSEVWVPAPGAPALRSYCLKIPSSSLGPPALGMGSCFQHCPSL